MKNGKTHVRWECTVFPLDFIVFYHVFSCGVTFRNAVGYIITRLYSYVDSRHVLHPAEKELREGFLCMKEVSTQALYAAAMMLTQGLLTEPTPLREKRKD
jgi:hypothetical protein